MSEPIAPVSAPQASEPVVTTGETLSAIFFEPSRAFEALRARPRFLVAGIILLLLTCLVTLVLFLRVDMGQYIRERMERSPNAAQQTEAQKELGVKFGKIGAAVFVPLSVPISIAAGAALYLLGVLAFGGSISYKKSLAVWTYSSLPPAVLGVLIAILVLFLKSPDSIDPEHLAVTNPGALTNSETSPVLVALLSQFDLLRFYGLFLAALGLRKVAKLSSGAAWGVVISLWLIAALLRIGSAAIFGR
ncbi:MAG TPA: YIP1 family protein [Pyrinomonadaceae bacterium]|nr:YIP1 family protein [Pyrinomonadaceae bacterium]